jgi:hypothetical protein
VNTELQALVSMTILEMLLKFPPLQRLEFTLTLVQPTSEKAFVGEIPQIWGLRKFCKTYMNCDKKAPPANTAYSLFFFFFF